MRLPVAHCTLNPIELAWAQVKGHIKSNAKAFNLTEVEQLARDGFANVTADCWKKLIVRVQEKVGISSTPIALLLSLVQRAILMTQ